MKDVVLGIDFGSDSVRCLVVDAADGRELSLSVVEYPRWKQQLYCNAAENCYRQHPLDYIESLELCVRQALLSAGPEAVGLVRGISFDCTASTPCLTDRNGTPLALLPGFEDCPEAMFVLWKDHTALGEADRINEVAWNGPVDYTRYCGGNYSCEWAWAKMLHCLRKAPSLRKVSWSWVEHGDWIAGLLTGTTSPETLVRSRCMAGHKAMWHTEWGGLPPVSFFRAVDPLLGIFEGHISAETRTGNRRVAGLSAEWAVHLGLPAGIAVGVGGIDCHVGAVGAGICPGTLVKVMGTSTCDIAVCRYEDIGSKVVKGVCGQVDGSVLPGMIGIEAGQAAFGDVFAWLSRFTGKDIRTLTLEAATLPLTQDDPIALDWFNGRRSPDPDQRLTGLISGLTLGVTPGRVFKSLVEATAFGSRAINERLIEEGIPIDSVLAVGGISRKSPYVMQVMADVLGVPIRVSDSEQVCALGAAVFASVAAGIHPSVEAAQNAMCPGSDTVYVPDTSRHALYDILYHRYQRLGQVIF